MHPAQTPGPWRNRLTMVLALAVTVYGMANVMPAIGSFRLGPFPMEMFRATFITVCAWVVALSLKDADGHAARGLLWATGLVGAGVLSAAAWFYYGVAIAMDSAMILFGPAKPPSPSPRPWPRCTSAGASGVRRWPCWVPWASSTWSPAPGGRASCRPPVAT